MIADFQNRKIVITGATGYLGKAFAHKISELGASCLLVDKDKNELKVLKTSLEEISNATHFTYAADFTVPKNVETTVKAISEKHNCIDTILNNAAFNGDSQLDGWATDFANQSAQAWQKALQVNLISCFIFAQQLMPALLKSDNASVINIASIYGELGPDYRLYHQTDMHNPAAYGASKAGLIQLTRWLAATMGPDIRVNAVSPGGIYRRQDEKFVKNYVRKTVLGRMANEEDIIPMMIFLASHHSSYITGQNFVIDGGYSIL